MATPRSPDITPCDFFCGGALKIRPSRDFCHRAMLQFICSLYQIDQLITEPTRVTPTLTNRPENVSESGVIHLGIAWSIL